MAVRKKSRMGKPKDFQSIAVAQIMQKKVQTATLRTKGDAIASMMLKGFGAVPVVNGQRKLAGVVSEHDLLAAMDEGHQLNAVAAGDIMTANPYSVRPETTLGTLVHVLRASDLVRVPVVDARDRLVGIVARRDVLRSYLGSSNSKRK